MARYNTSQSTGSINGSATISSPYQGAFTELTGTAPYTVTLPSPVLYPGANQTFYNATSGVVTLSTPAGIFTGTGGTSSATVSVYAGNVVSVTSDGTNYIVISEDGSALIATTGNFSSNVDISGTLTVTPTGGVNLSPSTTGTINNVAIGGTTRASGNFTTLAANNQVAFTGNIASSTTGTGTLVITGGLGVSGTINAANVSANLTGTLQTAAQPNITSVGTLTALTVSGLVAANKGINFGGYNAISYTSSGAMGIYGHNAYADQNATNRVLQINNSYYGHFIRMYYGDGIAFHTRTNTGSAGDVLYDYATPSNQVADSAERLRIVPSGTVGINTTNPNTSFKLDVRGAVNIGGGSAGLYLGNVGDNSAYDNIGINYTGFNSGFPQIIFQPKTTPGSGIVNSTFYFKNSNGTSTTSNNTANVLIDGNETVSGIQSQYAGLYSERTFDLGYFPNGVANQVVYLNFGNSQVNGNLEVTITSTYSYQNATGILRKVFSFGYNQNNSQWYPATSRVSEADGPIRDNIVIGEMEWDSTGSQYRLPIYHIVSSGNSFYAHVKSLGGSNIVPYITVSGFSTRSSPSSAASNVINIAGKRIYKEGDIAMWNGAATSATLSTIVSNNSDWVGFSDRYNSDSSVFEVVGTSPYGIRIKKAGWVYYYYDQDVISSGSSGYVTIRSAKNGSFLQYQLITNTNGQWDGIVMAGAVNVAANDVINFYLNASDITALDAGTWSNCSLIWYGNGG